MKRSKQLLFLGGIAAALLIGACNKNDTEPGPSELNELFESLRSPAQSFTVTAGTEQTITGAQGTKIIFYPNSFKDAAGNTLSSGSVNISLTEVYTPGQMIAHRTTTTTNDDRLLTSGGQVLITARQNGQELTAGQYELAFRQPAASEDPMALFYGVPDAETVIWDSDTSNTVTRTIKDSVSQENYYWFDSCTRFNWINCDYFYTAPQPKTDIFIHMPDASFDSENTQVFVIFPEINMVSCTYLFTNQTFSFGGPAYYLPLGTEIQVVVLSSKNNQHYMQVMPALSVSQDMSLDYEPEAVSINAIQAALADL